MRGLIWTAGLNKRADQIEPQEFGLDPGENRSPGCFLNEIGLKFKIEPHIDSNRLKLKKIISN